MAISQHTRFENYMDVASPETIGDATRVSDYFDENPYDDDFEVKLSQAKKNIVSEKNDADTSEGHIEEIKDTDSIMEQEMEAGEKCTILALNPTLASFKESEGMEREKEQDVPDNSLDGKSKTDAGNINHYHSIQQAAEKIVTIAATIDAVSDIFGGGVAAVAQPNKPSIDEIFPQMSIISREGHHDLGSIDDVIEELGVEINRPEEVDTEEVVIDVGQAIETIGNDEDNQVEFVDEQSRQKVEENEIAEVLILEEGEVPPNPSESGIAMKSAIVYKSVVDANPDYGAGGGNQYFIPHAYDLKQDGKLQQQSNPIVLQLDEGDVFKADIRNSEYANYRIHLDKRDLSEEETRQILASSSDEISDALNESICDDELRYLDDNTIETEGLTDTYNRFFIDENGKLDSHEDYYRPHGNQEDTYKVDSADSWVIPDSWSNPRELKEGESYYQLTALYSDGKRDILTSYFTDEITVDSCRNENGVVSAAALLQKLQMSPKKEIVIDENGENHEVYVNQYELALYVYRKDN